MRLANWRKDSVNKLENVRSLINDNPVTVDIYRIGTSGDGFSTEVGSVTKIATITARVEPVKSFYKMIERDINESMLGLYVGVTESSNVSIGDEWHVGSITYKIREFGRFGDYTEAILEVV